MGVLSTSTGFFGLYPAEIRRVTDLEIASTKTRVPQFLRPSVHWLKCGPLVNCHQRVGGRAGTAAPKGVVCELTQPARFSFPSQQRRSHRRCFSFGGKSGPTPLGYFVRM